MMGHTSLNRKFAAQKQYKNENWSRNALPENVYIVFFLTQPLQPQIGK